MIVEPARLAGLSLLRCQTDERLVDLSRAGNERAFEAIVDRYSRPLLRYCERLLPSARAEDVVQQAFLNAYSALHRDDRRIELCPWLYRIAHNAALNALRENGWSHDQLESAAAGTDTTLDAVERRAKLETVLTAVQTLPERQRDAMILRELEGRSYAQIALELDATGGAVRQLLNRARHTLRAAATALTPAGVLLRLPPGGGAVAARVSDVAVNETVRAGAGRIAGGILASLAVAVGLSEAPQHLRLPLTSHERPAHGPAGSVAQVRAARPAGLARWGSAPVTTGARGRGRAVAPRRLMASSDPGGAVVMESAGAQQPTSSRVLPRPVIGLRDLPTIDPPPVTGPAPERAVEHPPPSQAGPDPVVEATPPPPSEVPQQPGPGSTPSPPEPAPPTQLPGETSGGATAPPG